MIAVVLLLTFMVGTAPKAYFHDLIANHRDEVSCTEKHSTPAFHNPGFDCKCSDLVVSTPFIVSITPFYITPATDFHPEQVSFYQSHTQSGVQYKESRGPPAL